MIRYPIDEAALEQEIASQVPRWLVRAAKRTRKLLRARRYSEKRGIWHEIKHVYMKLQHDKCAYCERKLASGDYGGAIEHDLEHYRSKNPVEQWPTARIALERGLKYHFATGDALASGYYWLAYHLLNYCVACKKCNSPLKSNFFPIAGPRTSRRGTPQWLNTIEQPLLIFPLSMDAEETEDLIEFIGILAVPRYKRGPRWRRARVTIDFFS